MNTGALIRAIIAIIVAFVVTFVVAVPILSTFTETHPGELGENVEIADATTSLFELRPDSTVNITVGDDDTVTMTVNGTAYTSRDMDNPYAVICKNFTATTTDSGTVIIHRENVAGSSSSGVINVSYDGAEVTVGTVTKEYTYAVDHVYVVTDQTDVIPDWAVDTRYVMISNNANESWTIDAYVNRDSVIVAGRDGYQSIGAFFLGTYDDMMENTWHFGDHQTLTFTYENEGDAIHLTSYTVDPSDTATVYVPLEYYVELPDDGLVTGPTADIINIIPLIFSVGAVLFAAGAFVYYRS